MDRAFFTAYQAQVNICHCKIQILLFRPLSNRLLFRVMFPRDSLINGPKVLDMLWLFCCFSSFNVGWGAGNC